MIFCAESLRDLSNSLTHSGCVIYFCGSCMIFLMLRGCVIFFVESLRDFFVEMLHDFLLLRGCMIFFVERLRDFFVERLLVFLCGEVA